ncbi:imidazolonepropionase-like amidohydrolase [Anaerosolibacter carboniphilus]|uniref:Imidazolonepropionase-like amidohydrolase n=1 Tax=Anaerosolibacter carboniphilus TaxID=1417629 RepID=A0A841L076_9FIRM|nr:amidohydrolase [Anaerosolibacter carboniphilus]MBB6217610.1 imidazolonepropionase-like amidohydrolase [Anaerosolibacter carboniphilus]
MILIKDGMILTMEGRVYDKASILIEDGKIKEIGEDMVVPLDAEVIDAAGKIITPGIIDAHCHLGMWEDAIGFEGADGNEATDPVTPHLRAIDAINPMDRTFREAYEGGVTSVATGPGSANVIGGQFVAIKTYGDRIDNMIIKDPIAMKCAFGENPKRVYHDKKQSPSTRMATAAILRDTLFKAKEYGAKLKASLEDPSKKPSFDMKMEALQPVLRGEIPLKAHAHRADDIFTAIRIAKEFDVKVTLEHCTEGHLIVEHIKEEGLYAVVGPSFGERSKYELKNLTFETAGVLSRAGVKIAIMTDHPVIPLQYLPMCAALAVKAGMDEEEALKAITINAAEILGIDHRIGSIREGKDADLVIWDGHPFALQSKVDYTVIDGKVVYKRG